MKHHTLPYDLLPGNADCNQNVFIFKYQSNEISHKTRISLDYHLFSFLLEGEKNIYYSADNIKIDSTQFLMLSSGNCLMSEKTADPTGSYKSILLFFDNKILVDFFIKYPVILKLRSLHSFVIRVCQHSKDVFQSYTGQLQVNGSCGKE